MNGMRVIGFTGGGSLCELGPATDVQLFFDCLDQYVAQKYSEQDWSLLTDRLYRRYLRLAELDAASALMEQVKQVFAVLPNSAIEWQDISVDLSKTRLEPQKPTLADIFSKYFEHFSHCVESAKISYEGFKSYSGYNYEPVRIVIADQPWFIVEKKRPLAEYDVLSGPPVWQR